jgi:protein-disulfide isomerase
MPPVLASALIAACVGALAACGGSKADPAPATPSPQGFVITNIDEMLSDKALGSANAPITVINYSSLTSPQSATFHLDTLPQLRRSYIDTGQVRLIYRDFPVPGASTAATAVAAAALARCAGNAAYFDALDRLFGAQATWMASSTPSAAMKQAVAPLGMPTEKMDACLASAALQEGITRQRDEGQSVGVTQAPTILVNGQRVTETSFTRLATILQPLTPNPATCRGSCHRAD